MPETVVVGPIAYRITDSDDDWREIQLEDGTRRRSNLGYTWPDRALILLNVPHPQVRRETVLHEVMHVVAITAGIYGRKKRLTEERWVRLTAPLLLDTLKRNPELVAWLLDNKET